MSALFHKDIVLSYKYSASPQFQILENDNPVSNDLSTQTIKLYIIKPSDADFVKITKDIVTEGWVIDNTPTGKIFQIVIDTDTYLMTVGIYKAEVDWTDKEKCLVSMDISVVSSVKQEMS